ncbi:MAG: hypothetical protein NDI77_17510, partial [Geobacteraceae bacterium]|nr:hypothetical protein [Geobacteraceae bacterium]
PRSLLTDLERFLAGNQENVWENSWVRFPRRNLSPYAGLVFDSGRFIFRDQGGEEQLRLPIGRSTVTGALLSFHVHRDRI